MFEKRKLKKNLSELIKNENNSDYNSKFIEDKYFQLGSKNEVFIKNYKYFHKMQNNKFLQMKHNDYYEEPLFEQRFANLLAVYKKVLIMESKVNCNNKFMFNLDLNYLIEGNGYTNLELCISGGVAIFINQDYNLSYSISDVIVNKVDGEIFNYKTKEVYYKFESEDFYNTYLNDYKNKIQREIQRKIDNGEQIYVNNLDNLDTDCWETFLKSANSTDLKIDLDSNKFCLEGVSYDDIRINMHVEYLVKKNGCTKEEDIINIKPICNIIDCFIQEI